MTTTHPSRRRCSAARRLCGALAASALLAGGALLSACGSGASTSAGSTAPAPSAGARGGTLTVLSAAALNAIDPQETYQTWALEALTHDGLVGFKRVGGLAGNTVVPDLAVAIPKPTDGGRTWTFTLRPGIRYSDGRPLKASDFVRTFVRTFTVPTPASFYTNIVGAPACEKQPKRCTLAGGVVANDAARTVTFHLLKPDAEWLLKLSIPFAFAVPGDTQLNPLKAGPPPGTGPYMWTSYNPTTGGTLVRNPYFHAWSQDAQPDGYADRIVVKDGLSLESEVTEIENGQADVMYVLENPPADRLGELAARYPSQLHISSTAATTYFWLNTRVAPFNDVRARQAINYAVDRAAYVKIAGGTSLATPTCQILPPRFPGYEPYCRYTVNPGDGAWHGPDLAKARALVRASGTTGMKVTVVSDTDEVYKGLALQLVADLKKLGYAASTKLFAPGLASPYIANSSNKMQVGFGYSWLNDFPAASDFLNVAFSCHTLKLNSPDNINQAEFCSQPIQAAMDHAEAVGVTDPVAANKLWAAIDRRVTDAGPWLPLYTPKEVNFVSRRVTSFQAHTVYGILFSRIAVGGK